MARHTRMHSTGRARAAGPESPGTRAAGGGSRATRSDVPGRDVEDLPSGVTGPRRVRTRRSPVRLSRPEPPHGPVRSPDTAVQGLRLHGDAALPLAVLVLSEPR